MSAPQILQLHNVTVDAKPYSNVFTECKPPDLKRKYEAYKAGGMDTPIFVDLGGEPMEMEVTMAGKMPSEILAKFAASKHNAVLTRWAGWYRDQSTGKGTGVEVIARGRFNVDNSNAKTGEVGNGKLKFYMSYYKLTIDGKVLVEIDAESATNIVDGNDTLEPARNFLGI